MQHGYEPAIDRLLGMIMALVFRKDDLAHAGVVLRVDPLRRRLHLARAPDDPDTNLELPRGE